MSLRADVATCGAVTSAALVYRAPPTYGHLLLTPLSLHFLGFGFFYLLFSGFPWLFLGAYSACFVLGYMCSYSVPPGGTSVPVQVGR